MSREVAEEYLSSLADLTVNSKPLINMLTMLAEENAVHAPAIVEVIENHIQQVAPEVKLPILYLIDSIVKNVTDVYKPLFAQNIVKIFVSVFKEVDENTRLNMFKLRQTWNGPEVSRAVFPLAKLYDLDLQVKQIDKAWPLPERPSTIHLNPKFLQNKAIIPEVPAAPIPQPQKVAATNSNSVASKTEEMKDQLLKKTAILLELQKKKLELELLQARLEQPQQKQKLNDQPGAGILTDYVRPVINEDALKLLSLKALCKPKAVVMPPSAPSDSGPKLASLANAVSLPSKAKIAPANKGIIEAVKSRDPRIARQMQQSAPLSMQMPPKPQAKVTAPAASKEQEILSRQLAMLKTPVLDQVAQVAPVSRLGNDLNVKSHITINVDRNRDRLESKTNKKQSKDNVNKSDSSSSRSRSKQSSPRDSKSSPKSKLKSTPPSRSTSSPKRSQKRTDSPIERVRTPTKNERSLSPSSQRNKTESKWSKHKSSPRKSSKSSRSYSPKRDRDFNKSGSSSPKSDEKIRRNKKKSKKDDSENDYDLIDISPVKRPSPPVKAIPLKEKSPAKILSPKKEPSPANQKKDVENIPENKISKIKKKDKKDGDFNRRGKKSDGPIAIDLELIESSPSPEPPPPPIISRTAEDSFAEKKDDFEDISEEEKEKKEVTGFKDLKGVAKSRNYIRRNREPSTSPQKDVAGDVDHRYTGPPEKQPRLLFQDEKSSDIEKSLVNVSGKDVDLRLLTVGNSSPGSKRLSTDATGDEPPKKKNKTEVFDELFGNEDVDLRQMGPVNLNPAERLPSPPPPPVISNGPPQLQVAAIAPLIAAEVSKLSPKGDIIQPAELQEDEHSRSSFDSDLGRYRRPKVKPEAEIKPMSLSSQLELEVASRKDPYLDTPEKDRKRHGMRERGSPRGELDRLGRPLLYNKLPNDPRARRESLGVLDSRDTDMRRFGIIDRENEAINVHMIVAQAEDQVRNGTMSSAEYSELLKQVMHVNEVQKMREAQNKSRLESRRIQQYHHRSRRSPPSRFGPRNSPPFRHEEERRDRRLFNDIDDRLPNPWRSAVRNEPPVAYNRLPYGSGGSRFDMDSRPYETKVEIWEDERARYRRSQYMDDLETDKRLREVICTERTHDCVDVPEADESVLKLIAKDPMKSINIDGTPRDIRFYGDIAVVMLSWDDPRKISFEDGLRRVFINDQSFTCALNHDYTMVSINGLGSHRIRLGAPTREFYIDGEFYEVHFGGPPVQIEIEGLTCRVELEGPPPQVKIGEVMTDLVCGRINMVVDATAYYALYLDAKPQRIDLLKRPYVFRFVNGLKTLLINEIPVEIQFGGGCRQICGYGNLHFIRLSSLPSFVVPGSIKIVNMESVGMTVPANAIEPTNMIGTDPTAASILDISVPAQIKTEPQVFDQQPPGLARSGSLDILTNLLSSTTASEQPVGFNYQVETQHAQQQMIAPVVPEVTAPQPQPTLGLPFLGGNMNINDLFQRLVASGIVPTSSTPAASQQQPSEVPLKPVTFKDPSTLKERQPSFINQLYSGIQCSSCGVRFAPEETVKYSHHLDWHFRQNRREKDAARKGQSRKWYYDVSDWIQFEEIEDLEERAQSWFETEGTTHGEEQPEQEEVKSVPAPSGDENILCELCRDQFDIFYNEEKEEWHLKPCVIVEEKYYHPFCYEDLINMPDESFADKTENGLSTSKDESVDEAKPVEEEEPAEEIKAEPAESASEDVEMKEEVAEEEPEPEPEPELVDDTEEVVQSVVDELVGSVISQEELEIQKAEEEERIRIEEAKEKEIEVLENVTVEKNIIAVDLIETLDEEDDVVYQRKTPSPIVLIEPARIKLEPVDEMESPVAVVDQTYTSVVSSIDGNVEMVEAPQIAPTAPSKIKITFNKPLATEQTEKKSEKPAEIKESEITQEEEEPEKLPLKPRKPKLADRELTVNVPVVKGTEVSGLCSIM